MKLTPWFPVSTKPVRVGVYETRDDGGPIDWFDGFSYRDGRYWFVAADTVADALAHSQISDHVSSYQSRQWRGILKGSK